MCSKLGFYSLSGKVFDCDSKDIGSIPIKNPDFYSFGETVDAVNLGFISVLGCWFESNKEYFIVHAV
jgi:hypothetical protein